MPLRPEANSDTAAARLLVVARDAAAGSIMTANLAQCFAAVAHVDSVDNGDAAAAMLKASAYDVVLVELASLEGAAPVDQGVARLARLASGALLIALSDGGSLSATLAAMQAGAHDCLAKPVNERALAARIGELAQRHGRRALRMSYLGEIREEGPAAPTFAGLGGAGEAQPRAAAEPAVLPMWRQEQRIIEDAIASFSGNVALAAAALELSPSTLYRKRQAWAEADGRRGAA